VFSMLALLVRIRVDLVVFAVQGHENQLGVTLRGLYAVHPNAVGHSGPPDRPGARTPVLHDLVVFARVSLWLSSSNAPRSAFVAAANISAAGEPSSTSDHGIRLAPSPVPFPGASGLPGGFARNAHAHPCRRAPLRRGLR
jgi:hypothetical protein